jgi:hypothetical protein
MKKIILACALLTAAFGAKAQQSTFIIEPGLPPWLTPLDAYFDGNAAASCTPAISSATSYSLPSGAPVNFTASTVSWAGGTPANYFNRVTLTYGSGASLIWLTLDMCTLPLGLSNLFFSDGVTPLIVDNMSDPTQYRINIHQ